MMMTMVKVLMQLLASMAFIDSDLHSISAALEMTPFVLKQLYYSSRNQSITAVL